MVNWLMWVEDKGDGRNYEEEAKPSFLLLNGTIARMPFTEVLRACKKRREMDK